VGKLPLPTPSERHQLASRNRMKAAAEVVRPTIVLMRHVKAVAAAGADGEAHSGRVN